MHPPITRAIRSLSTAVMRSSRTRAILLFAALVLAPASARAAMEDTAVDLAEDAFEPSTPFDEATPPAAPDYSTERAWSAYPSRNDGSDRVPEGAYRASEASAAA